MTCPCTAKNTTGCSSLQSCLSANLKYKQLCKANNWGGKKCATSYDIWKCTDKNAKSKGKKIKFYPKFYEIRIKSPGVITNLAICSRFIHFIHNKEECGNTETGYGMQIEDHVSSEGIV